MKIGTIASLWLTLNVVALSAPIAQAETPVTDPYAELVEYNCGSWKNGQSETLLGVQIAIVSQANDILGGRDFLVRTAPVVPKPNYQYEVLKLVQHGVDSNKYESESYLVSTFTSGGRAYVQEKRSTLHASCLRPTKMD